MGIASPNLVSSSSLVDGDLEVGDDEGRFPFLLPGFRGFGGDAVDKFPRFASAYSLWSWSTTFSNDLCHGTKSVEWRM